MHSGKRSDVFPQTRPRLKELLRWRLSRGLAILDDTIFLATIDAQIIAIHADTGQEL
jgi:hypothetical protein